MEEKKLILTINVSQKVLNCRNKSQRMNVTAYA